jgi:CubicO group peptidase (beta-lactamase class C family)
MCFSKLVRHRLCFVVRATAITSTISLGVTIAQVPVEPEQRIRHIQDAILPAVFTKGEPPATTKLADRMAALNVPGVSIAVVHDGKIEWARGFGVTRVGGPGVTPDTLFQAASISKPVTAMAVLRLAESGKLDLDADVNQYLKSWKVPENTFTQKTKVTLRELLTHTAGITVHGFPGYASDSARPTVVQVLNGEKPANTSAILVDTIPGTDWRYSGGGFVVTQLLLEDVTGQAFPTLMHDIVLGPIGMTRSTYEQPLPQNRKAKQRCRTGRTANRCQAVRTFTRRWVPLAFGQHLPTWHGMRLRFRRLSPENRTECFRQRWRGRCLVLERIIGGSEWKLVVAPSIPSSRMAGPTMAFSATSSPITTVTALSS